MQWYPFFALSVGLLFVGVSSALPFYAEEKYETKYRSSYEFSSNDSDDRPFTSYLIAQDPLSQYFLKRDVSLPPHECSVDSNCSFTDIELVCGEDNLCGCEPPKCLHYELALDDRYLKYIFTCDECGLLGSECSGNGTCDLPGYCGTDSFCHCDYGQHLDSMCLLASISFDHYVLTASLCCLLLLIVLSYCTILWQPERIRRFLNRNNRSYGTELRNISRVRREMGRKTPAYTFMMMFNSEDYTVSESLSEDILVQSVEDEHSDLVNGDDDIDMDQIIRFGLFDPGPSNASHNEELSTEMSSNFIFRITSDISRGVTSSENNLVENHPSSSSQNTTPVISSSDITTTSL